MGFWRWIGRLTATVFAQEKNGLGASVIKLWFENMPGSQLRQTHPSSKPQPHTFAGQGYLSQITPLAAFAYMVLAPILTAGELSRRCEGPQMRKSRSCRIAGRCYSKLLTNVSRRINAG